MAKTRVSSRTPSSGGFNKTRRSRPPPFRRPAASNWGFPGRSRPPPLRRPAASTRPGEAAPRRSVVRRLQQDSGELLPAAPSSGGLNKTGGAAARRPVVRRLQQGSDCFIHGRWADIWWRSSNITAGAQPPASSPLNHVPDVDAADAARTGAEIPAVPRTEVVVCSTRLLSRSEAFLGRLDSSDCGASVVGVQQRQPESSQETRYSSGLRVQGKGRNGMAEALADVHACIRFNVVVKLRETHLSAKLHWDCSSACDRYAYVPASVPGLKALKIAAAC